MIYLVIPIIIILLIKVGDSWTYNYEYIDNTLLKAEAEFHTGEINILCWNIDMIIINNIIEGKFKFSDYESFKKIDILCLQEFFPSYLTKKMISDLANLGFIYNFLPETPRIHKVIGSGLAIFSKIPIVNKFFKWFSDSSSVDSLSDKGYQCAKIKVKSRDFYIVNTHMQSDYEKIGLKFEETRKSQIKDLKNFVDILPFNKVICGDFNTSEIDLNTKYKTSNNIDHVFSNFKILGVSYPSFEWQSDHKPMLVKIEI